MLGRLDVVLVCVGPMELHFLAVVGHREGRSLAGRLTGGVAARNEIAVVVVPFEKAVEVVVDLALGGGGILCGLVPGTRFLHLGNTLWLGCPVFSGGLNFLLVLGFELGLAGVVNFTEGIADDGEQVVFKEACYLLGLGVHDAVEPEVEVGLVQLEKILELVYQSGSKLLCCRHVVSPYLKVLASEW